MIRHRIGLDVGSTTVKAVAVDADDGEIVFKDYLRHDTRQAETARAMLARAEKAMGSPDPVDVRIFITGSGGAALAAHLGAKFVQEVNAVSLAVESLDPDAGSVIELGGQDAKIIIFKEDPTTGRKKKIPSMNDKCAGGTGAVIDKINAKLAIPADELCAMGYVGRKLHPVAGKCGVFAETDINGLQKQGVPPDELMASLFEAIVQQNLTVLTRGNTLRPHVLLLGGPNTFVKGMVEAWRHNIPKVWAARNFPLPEGVDPADLIVVPDNAQYYAAIGAVEFGREEADTVGLYRGLEPLRRFLERGDGGTIRAKSSRRALCRDAAELAGFLARYEGRPFESAALARGETVRAFLGVDGGSTSTKAVLLSEERNVIAKAYGLSKGNPIEDTKERIAELRALVEDQGATLEVLGVGTTGYAKDMLRDVLKADAAIVETVAHTESALHLHDDVDVVCDVGGQDIKIIALKNGKVKDFRLNTQCSAGNGYFLQSTAETFGVDVRDYATTAFQASEYPEFGYGCAVFMQSDIVDFQRQGWAPHEIMAGLAAVLPKNIWLYVSRIPNLARLGRRFLLQGGTQHNLAAVKAQVDFIKARFHDDAGTEPEVRVHEHTGEAGAIGAALEAARHFAAGRPTSFIGLEAVARIGYRTTRNESTRCYFCRNKCLRTFIDVGPAGGERGADRGADAAAPVTSAADLPGDTRRLIIATCEKGTVEDIDAMREIKGGLDEAKRLNPNLAVFAAKRVWQDFKPAMRGAVRDLRIGIPRALNMYSLAPFFTGYLQALGVPFGNFAFSDFTSEELYREGARRGSIDPCFPSKVSLAHVHNLIHKHHARRPLDWILFPMVDSLPSCLDHTLAARACPTVTNTPESVKAAFTKEDDVFRHHGIEWVSPFVSFTDERILAHQMHGAFGKKLRIKRKESDRATAEGLRCLRAFETELRSRGGEVIGRLVSEDRLGIVLLGRPYHNDLGLNHGILEELQKSGYPILTTDSLPDDDAFLDPLFREEIDAGVVRTGRDIGDAWKNSYSENTSRKIWAAKVTARHPNLVGLELSNFKCGHDAPIYTVVEEIVENSGTPFFAFKDIDENKPTGSIRIRVETITYFLQRYREELLKAKNKRRRIEERLTAFEAGLRAAGTGRKAASG